jgi:hypothetical protein
MGKLLCRSSLILRVLSLWAAANTQAQSASELRCRGGEEALVKLFVIDRLDANTLSLNFNSSRKPAGTDSSGLEPGTCSWIDRTVKDEEWRQIHFVLTAAQARSIPIHLKDRNNYWSFLVITTDRGYFEAKSHQVWTAGQTKRLLRSPHRLNRSRVLSRLRRLEWRKKLLNCAVAAARTHS